MALINERQIVLFDSVVVRLKQSCITVAVICSIAAMHLDLLHGPEWLKDTINLIALIYMALSRPVAYKE